MKKSAPTRLVYLDSQDYSKLADAETGLRELHLRPVLDELRKIRDSGYFRFCFSTVLFSELLQVGGPSLEIAKRKARLLQEFCQNMAFPNPFWLLSVEIAAAAAERGMGPRPHSQTINNVVTSGDWLAEELGESGKKLFERVGVFTTAQLNDTLREMNIPMRLTRADRRRLQRQSRLAPSDDIIQSFQTHKAYPVIAATGLDKLLADVTKGKRPRSDLSHPAMRTLALPETLLSQSEFVESIANLNVGLNQFGRQMLSAFQMLREDTGRLQDAAGKKYPVDIYREQIGSAVDGMWLRLVKSGERATRFTANLSDYINSNSLLKDLPRFRFVSFYRELMEEFLWKVIDNASNQRTLKESDGADILHSLYAPYCSVWRTDKPFSHFVEPVARKYDCIVVRRLVDLPDVLHQLKDAT